MAVRDPGSDRAGREPRVLGWSAALDRLGLDDSPLAAAAVALAAAGPVERLERSWEDAARLAGASPFRIWRSLSWPMVRPSALRAAALVFLFALVEPGAPLILGLRRTLAFQIVEPPAGPIPSPASRSGP